MFSIQFTYQIIYVHTPAEGGACNGRESCCTPDNKCEENDGDCNSDVDCVDGLKCGKENCNQKSGLDWVSTDNCCYKPDDDEDRPCTLWSQPRYDNNT